MTNVKPTKAVIPLAGFGTRFLPWTKAMPKEMLPLVDKPILQYLVEQLVDAGVTEIIMVVNDDKASIKQHFAEPSQALLDNLAKGGTAKQHYIDEVKAIAQLAKFTYVNQGSSFGNAAALFDVEQLVGDEPFFYIWGDDLILSTPPCFAQMAAAYQEYNVPIICATRLNDPAAYQQYGFIGGEVLQPAIIDVQNIVEKPGSSQAAPSDCACGVGFILTSQIFPYLHQAEKTRPKDQELYVNDVLARMMEDKRRIVACTIQNGNYYDTGDKLAYLKAVVDFALLRDDSGPAFKTYLKERLG